MTEARTDTPQDNQVFKFVAVMGATGTGKTTFVNRASGSSFEVGDSLVSCTTGVTMTPPFKVAGRNVILIDTPGFDDTYLSDAEILNKIAEAFFITYHTRCKLSGVIYLHRISDNRVTDTMAKNFKLFKSICGEDTLRNVVLATTMWGEVTPHVGQLRENYLKTRDEFFKKAISQGAQFVRHEEDSTESAMKILKLIINNHPLPLRVQTEMIQENLEISQTQAAGELDRHLTAMEQRYAGELRNLKARMERENASDRAEMVSLWQGMQKNLEDRVRRLEEEREKKPSVFTLLSQLKEKVKEFARDVERSRSLQQRVFGAPKHGGEPFDGRFTKGARYLPGVILPVILAIGYLLC